MSKLGHSLWAVALVLVGVLVFGWQQRRVGAANERARTTLDSLTQANHARDSLEALRLRQVADQQRIEARQAAQLARSRAQTDSFKRLATSEAAVLRAALADSLQALFDSLQVSQARVLSSVEAQRDSAVRMFLGAAAQRDTLATLLRASQAARAATEAALVRASRRGFTEGPVFRWGTLALAYIAGRKL